MPLLLRLAAVLVACVPAAGRAQAPTTVPTALPVFLDCQTGCDDSFIRTEIEYVNWVRDRTVADVHVLITSQDAGAGGEAFTLAFIGLRAQAGRGDTLTFTTNPTTTDDEERRGLVRTLSLGLVQFIARTPGAELLRVTSTEPAVGSSTPQVNPANDPWRAWVFEIDLSGDISGEQRRRNIEFDTEVNANRTTEKWKVNIEASVNRDNQFDIDEEYDDDGELVSVDTVRNNQRSWNTEFLAVRSVTNHLSVGIRGSVSSSTFNNQKRRIQFLPAIEYNVFPYGEFTRRRLAFQLGGGIDDFIYQDTTVFDKLEESFPMLYSSVIYATRQPWGESGIQLRHQTYLNDPTKRSTELSGDMEVRVWQGVSVRFGGSYEWIHDQVYLEKGRPSQADLLLRRRALLTGFEYNAFVGITYTFGSIFNNVVNPRFF